MQHFLQKKKKEKKKRNAHIAESTAAQQGPSTLLYSYEVLNQLLRYKLVVNLSAGVSLSFKQSEGVFKVVFFIPPKRSSEEWFCTSVFKPEPICLPVCFKKEGKVELQP